MPGNLGAIVSFDTFDNWERFLRRLDLHAGIPDTVAAKFIRAQKLYLLGWVDADLIKAGELVSLTALELALIDRYAPQAEKIYKSRTLARLLRYMVEYDGLTNDRVAMNQRCGAGEVFTR
jgi:hypothetical protein